VSPNSHNAWNNIGDDYDKLANSETNNEAKMNLYYNAIKGFGQSYAIKSNYADAYHNQANIFYKIGRTDLARLGYERAISLNPNLYQTYITLVQIDLTEKNEPELLRHLSILQKVKPNDLQIAYISAVAYSKIGRIEEAKQLAEIMYKQLPNVAEIKNLYDSLNTPSKN
jgi:tetratricopeptide (TPR) repeat protein